MEQQSTTQQSATSSATSSATQRPTVICGGRSAYTLCEPLGHKNGVGNGAVCRATDTHGQQVTVKRIERNTEAARAVAMRLMESPEAAGCDALARVLDCFTATDGCLYVVKEYIAGSDLKSIYADKSVYGQIDEDRFLDMARTMLRALDALHKAGVVHRDVKPSNIIVRHEPGADMAKTDMGRVVLTDFERADLCPSTGRRTAFTLIYSPPEMVLKRSTLVGPQADIYALGVTLYHMVMGKSPFSDCNPEVLITLMVKQQIKKPGRMTPELFAVIERAVAKADFRKQPSRMTPDEIVDLLRQGIAGRYASAAQMLADLQKVEHALLPPNWWQRTFGM